MSEHPALIVELPVTISQETPPDHASSHETASDIIPATSTAFGPTLIQNFVIVAAAGGDDVENMGDTNQCASEIRKKVTNFINKMNQGFSCEGITKDMIKYAQERVSSELDTFAEANKRGIVMCTMC
ncbi:hypothetical protein VNI00_014279 [Paramarasmius palmivorus]|uniref:Uncharacterized protein n=1 Tax=Paramarasmius palmivorus TaxID=297713 RepID=A0AAW0BWA5_9AGAR